ncbi:hypothetical protein G7Y79_00049g084830 [Physcia stellaris]|nr:hypothetical protein G7Y79_00049g084830 [Physcia stellaris]
MAQLPDSYTDPVPIAIIGGTGLSSLPSPPFTPLALIPPPKTPWGLPSSPISILSYTPPSSTSTPNPKATTIAFLARHGLHHQYAPHEIPTRANVAALRRLGVTCAIGFSAVGSLKEEVKPRDFVVVDQVLDWTKGVRPWTFFESGTVGHVSMADPFDRPLSTLLTTALSTPNLLEGPNLTVHPSGTVICIEGPQFSTRAESILYRSFGVSCINMSAMPEAKLFREAEIAFSLICMSTDYDSWHSTVEGVSVEMVLGHMVANGANAKRVVAKVVEELSRGENREVVEAGRWRGQSRAAAGITKVEGRGRESVERLKWLFEGTGV